MNLGILLCSILSFHVEYCGPITLSCDSLPSWTSLAVLGQHLSLIPHPDLNALASDLIMSLFCYNMFAMNG